MKSLYAVAKKSETRLCDDSIIVAFARDLLRRTAIKEKITRRQGILDFALFIICAIRKDVGNLANRYIGATVNIVNKLFHSHDLITIDNKVNH